MSMDKAGDRRLDVLRAIVSDYVETQEPVGSKALVERHSLGVSAATIRNDMAVLEEEGLIRQPHTSAGRIPTDKGYRFFVDQIDQIKPLSAPERRAITEFFEQAVGLEDVMERTVRLLAHLTHQTAMIEFPAFSQSGLRHLELVPLGSGGAGATAATPVIKKVLAIVISLTGRVDQILVDLPTALSENTLNELATPLENLFGETSTDQPDSSRTNQDIEAWLSTLSDPDTRESAQILAEAIATALAQGQAETRIVLAGMANLARAGDFQDTLTPLVEALEEQVVLLNLFNEMREPEAVSVIIGQESGHEVLRDTAIVSSRYDATGASAAHVGVIGPTRMDYPGSMSAVRAVARYLSRFLHQ
ncbi:MAG: heat-inducible transcriptional repressor HrcA [Mobiluncus porci]|uniref:heat-inducible transcriptional repressor HrcA n=1 Tax=Mobiluncus porci TaxID=2652278 RepID=UPI0023EFC6DB|nr:heat-inducible transcriptional repressor HrcA [Mobiluncus porci]MDD7541742.1 heat-inducible transcriptional repressor HrcA [Mobiluncus porci]MDY5747990.1 heat-inducible transcriptional repressor HrcA [Mobiluncus porci]